MCWRLFSLLRFKIVRIYNYGVVIGCTCPWMDSSLSFRRIPKEEKQVWLNVIKRKHWAPTNNDRVCELHFISSLNNFNC